MSAYQQETKHVDQELNLPQSYPFVVLSKRPIADYSNVFSLKGINAKCVETETHFFEVSSKISENADGFCDCRNDRFFVPGVRFRASVTVFKKQKHY